MRKNVLVVLCLAVVALAGVVVVAVGGAGAVDPPAKVNLDSLPLVGPVGLRAFEDNEPAAVKKYKGKRVQAIGVVGSVKASKKHPGKAVVILPRGGNPDSTEGLLCIFNDPDEVTRIKAQSQQAEIQGIVGDYDDDNKTLTIWHCRLEALKEARGDRSTGGVVGGNFRWETVWERKK